MPWTKKLHLVLPSELNDLVNQVKILRLKPHNRQLNAKLEDLLTVWKELEISLKSIKDLLPRLLYEHSQGDLAVVKAVTNASGRNYDNLIHYASLNRGNLSSYGLIV